MIFILFPALLIVTLFACLTLPRSIRVGTDSAVSHPTHKAHNTNKGASPWGFT